MNNDLQVQELDTEVTGPRTQVAIVEEARGCNARERRRRRRRKEEEKEEEGEKKKKKKKKEKERKKEEKEKKKIIFFVNLCYCTSIEMATLRNCILL